MKSILDKDFRYTPSHSTSIAKTFARERKRIAEVAKIAESAQRAVDAEKQREAQQAEADTAAVQAQFARRRIKAVK